MCGVFGFVDYGEGDDSELIEALFPLFARACEIRGADASGLSYISEGKLISKKEPMAITKAGFTFSKTKILMAHCRLSTEGNHTDNKNNHPFRGRTGNGQQYDLMHNGILGALKSIRKTLSLPQTEIETDSYCGVQVLNTCRRLDLEALRFMCETLKGSYAFTILSENSGLYLCRGDVPIYVVHFKSLKLYVYASTRDLFEQAVTGSPLEELYQFSNPEIEISPVHIIHTRKGDIWRITEKGELSRGAFSFQEQSAIKRNWYIHNVIQTPELLAQIKSLNDA